MSPELTALIIFLSLIILILTGFPVAFCLISVSIIGYLAFIGPAPLFGISCYIFDILLKDVYIAVPLFIFMATILQFSGLASALYETMYKWMAGLKGGLAMGTVAICALIAAMTGIGATGTVTMGLLAYPEMRKRAYDKGIAIGCIPFGGALGPLIPPSIVMIVAGGFAHLSVGKLFMGGVFPGVITALLGMIYIGIRCFRNPKLGPPVPLEERATWQEKFISLRGAILPIILIVVVLGGIYSGAATPTEAGGVGAFGALICAAIYRKLNLENLKEAITTTIRVTAMVMWLLIGGMCFSSLTTVTGVTHVVGDLLVGLPMTPIGIVAVMMVIVFILGM